MTGQPAYTDADVQAALVASERAKWETMRAIVNGTPEAEIRANALRAVLDAVAPAIAARALREAADAITGDRGRWVNHSGPELTPREFDAAWLRARANKIESP